VRKLFSRRARLHLSKDFEHTFKQGSLLKTACCKTYAAENTHSYARLGVIIAKKVIPLSTQRHQWKRIVRESFRLHANYLAGYDIIVILRRAPLHKKYLRNDVDSIWHKIDSWRKGV
jgi:ribonuclease P protein component